MGVRRLRATGAGIRYRPTGPPPADRPPRYTQTAAPCPRAWRIFRECLTHGLEPGLDSPSIVVITPLLAFRRKL